MAPIKVQKKKNIDPPPLRCRNCPSSDWWDNFSKRFSGSLHGQNNLAEFGSFFKFSRKTFDYICGLVKEEMMAEKDCTDLEGENLSLNDRVAIALRRLSSGESLATIGNYLRVHQSAVDRITWSFVQAMETKGFDRHLHWPSNEKEMKEIKSKFIRIRGLPNCCGAIETTNIAFSDPSIKMCCNEDNTPSMMLQAIVDPDMRFLDVFIGFPGCLSYSNVLRDSSFFRLCEEGKRLDGKKHELAKGVELREYIVGDEKFPLLPWLLTPYQGGEVLSVSKEDFNRRHDQMWKVANQALTRLKETWKIILVCPPDKDRLPRIAYVCCLLHNIMIDQNEAMECRLSENSASIQRDNLALYSSPSLPPY